MDTENDKVEPLSEAEIAEFLAGTLHTSMETLHATIGALQAKNGEEQGSTAIAVALRKQVEAERDRLREALETIVAVFEPRKDFVDRLVIHGAFAVAPIEKIAKAALAGKE